MLNSRPSAVYDEASLLRMQQDFFAQRDPAAPSTKMVRCGDKRKSHEPMDVSNSVSKAPSKAVSFARDVVEIDHSAEVKTPSRSKIRSTDQDKNDDAEARLDSADRHVTSVLSSLIMERTPEKSAVLFPTKSPGDTTGFPVASRGGVLGPSTEKKGRSLFSRQMATIKDPDSRRVKVGGIIDGSGLGYRGDGEANKIHLENLGKLSVMSESAILEDQRQIREMLSASTLEFLKNRKSSSAERKAPLVLEYSAESEPEKDSFLPVKPTNEWVNMDVVESEKLEWLRDVKVDPKAKTDSGREMRFDFDGRALGPDDQFPTSSALYHHDRQTEPGYTLEELFTLSRSQFAQQRVLALRTLAKISFQARICAYDEILSRPLFPHLLEAGVVFLLRWALDDGNAGVMAASVEGLASMLVISSDEACLNRTHSWYRGMLTPSLRPLECPQDSEEDETPPTQRSDVEMVARDIILALIQMNVLPRLRYILEVVRPHGETVFAVFDILIRICRHSREAAASVLSTPRLIETVTREFVATRDSGGSSTETVYGKALPKALTFLRVVVASAGRAAALKLENEDVVSKLLTFVTIHPLEQDRDLGVGGELCREAARLIATMIRFKVSVEQSFAIFPVLMSNLRNFSRLSSSDISQVPDVARATELLTLVSAFIEDCRGKTPSKFRNDLLNEDGDRIVVNDASLDFDRVRGFLMPLTECCGIWIRSLIADRIRDDAVFLDLIAAGFNCVASLFQKWKEFAGEKPKLLTEISVFAEKIILPFLLSNTYEKALALFSKNSLAVNRWNPILDEAPQLPSLRCLSLARMTPPTFDTKSSLGFLLSVSRVVAVIAGIAKPSNNVQKLLQSTLQHPLMLSLVDTIGKSPIVFSWPLHFEISLLKILIESFVIQLRSDPDLRDSVSTYHSLALNILPHLTESECVLKFAQEVVFSPAFNHRPNDIEDSMQTLDLNVFQVRSATHENLLVSKSAINREAVNSLSSIRGCYMDSFVLILKGRTEGPTLVKDFTLSLPLDWPLLPLVEAYRIFNVSKDSKDAVDSQRARRHILAALRFVHLLETTRPTTLALISPTVRLSRLYCVFLSGNDVFFEVDIYKLLASLFRHYAANNAFLDALDFSESVPGLASFYDLFEELLSQFQAVSFGDPLFSSFILLALQQKHSVLFRKSFWIENGDSILPSFTLGCSDLLVSVDRFLFPPETDTALLRHYLQALLSKRLRRSPLLYSIAVAHVNAFIFGDDPKSARLRRLFAEAVTNAENDDDDDEPVASDILLYERSDVSAPRGFLLHEKLPSERSERLKSFLNRDILR